MKEMMQYLQIGSWYAAFHIAGGSPSTSPLRALRRCRQLASWSLRVRLYVQWPWSISGVVGLVRDGVLLFLHLLRQGELIEYAQSHKPASQRSEASPRVYDPPIVCGAGASQHVVPAGSVIRTKYGYVFGVLEAPAARAGG